MYYYIWPSSGDDVSSHREQASRESRRVKSLVPQIALMTEESKHSLPFRCTGPEAHEWPTAEDAAKCCNGYRRAGRIKRTSSDDLTLEFYWEPICASPETPARRPTMPADRKQDTTRRDTELELNAGHTAFLLRLGEFAESTDPRWSELAAGCVTLRLIDKWMSRAAVERDTMAQEHMEVRRTIAAVADAASRNVLLQLLQAARVDDAEGPASLPVVLMSYGGLLETNAEWTAAIDVYTTARRFSCDGDRTGLPLIYGRLGFCHRQLGDLEAAASAYDAGERLATDLGLPSATLRLQSSRGVLALHRGNIPEAARILDGVIEKAAAEGHQQVFARASHDRGAVAIKQGEPVIAAMYFDKALRAYDNDLRKERALEDLADALYLIGAHESARDAFLINSAVAVQREVRTHAVICLMRLAVDHHDELMFETYSKGPVETEGLPVHMEAQLHRQLAIGFDAFGRRTKARFHYHALLYIANKAGLAEYVLDAEAGLSGRNVIPGPVLSAPLPSALASVASRLRECRDALAATPDR